MTLKMPTMEEITQIAGDLAEKQPQDVLLYSKTGVTDKQNFVYLLS